jgi:DNA-binding NarL/FixJ family response regulator
MTETMSRPLATYSVPRRHLQVVHVTDQQRLRPLPKWVDRLSDREVEVLHCIAAGLSTTEIASTLFISTATVKSHIARLIAKVEVRDRLQLVIAAYRSGFVVVE